MTNWGQAYIPVAGSTAINTRCQIRNVKSYQLRNDRKWYLVQNSLSPEGAAYVENFANNANIASGARDESANGGGVSVIVGVGAWAGHNFHFWSAGGRAIVDETNIVGVFTTCEARLIVDDPNKPDDRSTCKNILQMGADWWLNTTTGWLPDWSANSGIGGGRSKWVTSNWQSFNFCTLTPTQIFANPPPPFGTTTGIANISSTNIQATLYPNPANKTVIINYQLITNSEVKISLYDLLGKEVMQIVDEKQNEGERQLNINTEQLQNGVYFVRMNTTVGQTINKLIINK